MLTKQSEPDPTPLTRFEDIIDGYFPLKVSLAQMMDRLQAGLAYVALTHAPIMEIPGLSPQAPVPLNIRAGRAGMIECLRLRVTHGSQGTALQSKGTWRWFDGAGQAATLDPSTRLAEPAFVQGLYLPGPPDGHDPRDLDRLAQHLLGLGPEARER